MDGILVIDTFTIVAAVAVLVIGSLTALFSPFIRFKREDEEHSEEPDLQNSGASELPQLSIILSPHDDASKLETNLPLLLHQNYPAGYQVIVVIEEGERETEDVIKRLQGELDNNPGDGSLYMTYIPESSRYMSRKKLAMTLGVKAARTEWVLFTEAYCKPSSELWLQAMASHCNDYTNLVIGYGNYDSETSTFKRFERLSMAYYLMREDTKGTAYTTLSHNIMLRKKDFMEQEGFRGNLELIRGEYDFLVNKYATDNGTALVTDENAWMTDDEPTKKSWLNKHIFYAETRKFLERSGKHRMWFNLDQIAIHFGLWFTIAGIVYGAVAFDVILLFASILAFVNIFVSRTIIGYKAVKAFGENIPALAIYPYQLSLVWHNLNYQIRHHFADKYDFTTHKQ